MVRMKESSESDKLDALIRGLCAEHGFRLDVTGWARKTYDVFLEEPGERRREHMSRVESLATSNGEVRFFDDRAATFAEGLGEGLEKAFGLAEAVLIREKAPGGY